MINHRNGRGDDSADMEALQSDVMRFLAILALSLAAIFSLVHSAAVDVEHAERGPESADVDTEREAIRAAPPAAAPASAPTTRPGLARPVAEPRANTPVPRKTAAVEPPPEPRQRLPVSPAEPAPADEPAGNNTAPRMGFTLEFASAQVLRKLLQSGRIRLYAQVDQQFWSLRPSGRFLPDEAPGAYYEMSSATVPADLRQTLPAGREARWGVTLPPATIGQLHALMKHHAGGRLLIARDGTVSHDSRGH